MYFSPGLETVIISDRLSYIVDLRQYLPEFLTFGFSAATGNLSSLHTILSWNFTSNLEVNGNGTAPGTNPGTDPGTGTPHFGSGDSNRGLIIGMAVGSQFLH